MSSRSLLSLSSSSSGVPSRNPSYSLSLDDVAFLSPIHTRRHPAHSIPVPPPPPYVRFESHGDHHTATEDINWTYAESLTDGIERVTHGEVIKAKLRYKLHKLRRGKRADPWDVFQNRFLKPGEAPWAPLDSPLWKLPKSSSSSVVVLEGVGSSSSS